MKPKHARRIGVLIWDTRRDARQGQSGRPVGEAGRAWRGSVQTLDG